MKHRVAIAISIILLAAGAIDAAAGAYDMSVAEAAMLPEAMLHESGPRHVRLSRRIRAYIASQLDLTEAQKTEIKAILDAERPTIEPLVRQLVGTRKELRSVTDSGQFDESQVRALAEQQAQTITELIVAKERVKSKVYAVLTPEQRDKAAQMRARFEDRVRHWLSQ
jgi:Spy/CpxP family protein refolding chaperone